MVRAVFVRCQACLDHRHSSADADAFRPCSRIQTPEIVSQYRTFSAMFPPNQLALREPVVDSDDDKTSQTPSPPGLALHSPIAYMPDSTPAVYDFSAFEDEDASNAAIEMLDAPVPGGPDHDIVLPSSPPPPHLDEDISSAIGTTVSRLSDSACEVEYLDAPDGEIPCPREPPTGSPPTQLDLQLHEYYQHEGERRYLDALPPPPNQLQERPIKELRARREERVKQEAARKRIFARENAYKQPALRKDVLKASFLK